jgi:hypothetical protein
MNRPRILLAFFLLAFGAALLAQRVAATGGTTQNCCNLFLTTTTPTVLTGSTSAQIDWSTFPTPSNSAVLWGAGAPSWRTVQQISAATLNDVSVVSSRVQWAVDNAGNALRTVDGWATYSFVTDPGPASLSAIAATSDTTAWVLSGGSIYKTTNAGVSWAQSSPAAASGNVLRDIVMRDNSEGVIVGDNGTIIQTTDGSNWNCIAGSGPCPVNSWAAINLTVVAGYFENPTAKNYAVGGTSGTILKATGATLQFVQYPIVWSTSTITSIDMAGPDVIWATHGTFQVLVKQAGTSTFTQGSTPTSASSIVAVSPTEAYYGDNSGSIRRIYNGGTAYDFPVTITPAATGVTFLAGGQATPTSMTFVGTNGTVVRYAAPYTSIAFDTALVTSHPTLLTGLSPSTTYHYTVQSVDTSTATNWRVAESQDLTFTTVASGVPTTVTKTIGTAAGRNFTTPQAWEDARDGNLVTRNRMNVTGNTGTFALGETVRGQTSSCSGTYVPEDQVRTNGPILTLDNFLGPCTAGESLLGLTSAARANFQSLASNGGTLEVGEMYNDSVYTTAVTLDGSLTDSTHYLWLKAAAGNQHSGTRGSGARFQLPSGRPITALSSYTRIQGLEFDLKTRTSSEPQAVFVAFPAKYGILEDLLVYDGDYAGVSFGDYVTGPTIRNSIFISNNRVGQGGSIQVEGPHDASDVSNVYNNTVYSSGTGGVSVGGVGSTNITINARNNVVVGSVAGDYRTSYSGQTAAFTGSSNNLSADLTAPGSGSLPGRNANALNFRSNISGAEDVRIKIGSAAIDVGTNLSSQGFSNDFVARNRNDTSNFGASWDLGAYEADQTPPSAATFNAFAGYSATQGYQITTTITGCSTDPQSGVDNYGVYIDGVLSYSQNVCPGSGIRSGFAPGTTYSVTVRPVNNDGFITPAGTPFVVTMPSPSFTVSVSKALMVVTAGGSGDTVTVTVTSRNGFLGTVNLLDTVPLGQGTFVPISLSVPKDGSATSQWTINASAGTAAGNATVTVTGVSGSLTASVNLTEQVTDFSLNPASPASGSVTPGSSTTFTVPISMVNSSAQFNYVASAASAPVNSSITYSWSPLNAWTQSGTAFRSQSVTVNTTGSTPPGTYTITVSVAYHGKTVSTPFTLTVLNPDFSVSANPASLTVNQGTSATENAVLTAVSGYSNAAVAVSITGLPAGVTATNSTVSLSVASSPRTVPLTITVPANQPLGSSTPTIRAQDSTGLVRTTTFTLNIVSPYTVAASPASDSTIQGTTKNFNVVITGSNGYSDTVNTTFTSSNPGITVSPTSVSLVVSSGSPVAQTPVTVTVGAAVPVGVYTITLNATGATSGVARTATYTITVSAAPDFAVASSPTSVSVQAGMSATYALSFSTSGGYTGSVTLSLTGLPASIPNANYTTNPVNLPAQNSSTLAIPVPYDPATVGGPYNLTLSASDGTKTKTVALTLTVTPDTTPPIILTGPAANSGSCPTPTTCTATVTWTTNEGADGTVLYSTDTSFSSTTFVACPTPGTCPTLHTLTLSGLSENTLYNYRVRSTNPFGLTVTSAPLTFTTGTAPDTQPPALSFTTPSNGATVLGVITITVSGTDNRGISTLTISETGPLHASGQTLGTFSTPTTGTPLSGTYTTTWDTNDPVKGEPNGSITLTATAVDSVGNTQSVSITININNDKTPPIITAGPTVTVQILATTATATISWNTNEASTTSVQYGLERADGTYTYGPWIDNLSLNTAHQVILSNLQLRSRYHYQIRSCDASNNCVF